MGRGGRCLLSLSRDSCLGSAGIHLRLRYAHESAGVRPFGVLRLLACICCSLCLLLLSADYALAELPTPSDVAIEAGKTLVAGILSEQQGTVEYKRDLVKRWFLNPSKQSKVPVRYNGRGAFYQSNSNDMTDTELVPGDLVQFREYFSEKSPTEQLKIWLNLFANVGGMSRDYDLLNYNDSSQTWNAGSINKYIEYAYWYDYFEGTTPSGGNDAPSVDGEYTLIPVTSWAPGPPSNLSGVTALAIPTNSYNAILSWQAQNAPSNPIQAMVAGATAALTCMTCNVDWYEHYEPMNRYYCKVYYSTESSTASYIHCYGSYTVSDGVVYLNQGTTTNSLNMNQTYQNMHYLVDGTQYIYYRNLNATGDGGGGGSDTPVWPVNPEPDVPSPPTTPDNVTYVVNEGDTVTHVTNNNTTTTVDLTPILEAIRTVNSNIISYGDAINADFDTLSNNIAGYFDTFTGYFGDWMDTISGQLQTWNEQFLIEIRNVESWLESIFYKAGGGNSPSEPDISVDDGSWWDWLSGILETLLGDLPSAVTELSGTFDGLHTLFPFSIPWDLAAMLALFVSEPVTPVFDIPMPYGYANGAALVASVHVDLSQWDGVMSAVRSVELVAFAAGLALKTRQLLSNVEVSQ